MHPTTNAYLVESHRRDYEAAANRHRAIRASNAARRATRTADASLTRVTRAPRVGWLTRLRLIRSPRPASC